jgi:hypothetical protein
VRLLQEVDTGSSAETTVSAGLIQLSVHGKNRCFLFHQSVASAGGKFEPCAGLGGDNFRDSQDEIRGPVTRTLAYT